MAHPAILNLAPLVEVPAATLPSESRASIPTEGRSVVLDYLYQVVPPLFTGGK